MRQIKKDSTNISVELYIIDDVAGTPETGVVFDTSGIDLNFRRDGAAVVSITEVTLAALTTGHTDGGFLHVANGRYRLDLPDAAFATGVSQVTIGGTVTGMVVLPVTIQLVDFDPDDAIRMGLTALPNAAADGVGGLPISDTGGLDLDSKLANTDEITVARMATLTDWIDGQRLDLLIDAILLDTGTTLDGKINTIDTVVDAVKVKTDFLPSILAGAAGGVFIAGTNAATTVTGAFTTTFTGNLTGSVASVSGAVGSVAGNVGGNVTGTVASVIAKTGYSLSTAGILAVWHQTLTTIVTAGSVGKLLKDEITSVRMAILTDWIDGQRLDTLLDAIPTTAMRGTENGATAAALATAQNDLNIITGADGVKLATAEDVYHTDIDLSKDDASSKDEYTVTWFKNGVRITSGITVPKIQVVKRVDGTDLIANTAMTQVGGTGSYKYDEDTNRITAGEAVLVIISATIDAGARSFARMISRDSS